MAGLNTRAYFSSYPDCHVAFRVVPIVRVGLPASTPNCCAPGHTLPDLSRPGPDPQSPERIWSSRRHLQLQVVEEKISESG